jgi:DNA-binding transcriptional regulator YiaG
LPALAKVIPIKGRARTKTSPNLRVRQIDKYAWQDARMKFFKHNVKYAAAAKAFRTALNVTQKQMSRVLNLSHQSIANRESGKYAWQGGEQELKQYCDRAMLAARRYQR